MKKTIAYLLTLFSSVTAADELKIYIWEDYISPQLVQRWEQKTGHKVTLTYFDNEESRDAVLGSDNAKAFDLTIMNTVAAQLFGKNNKLYGVSHSNLPSLKFIDPKWRDSCGNFGLPYLWGSLGILYKKNKVVPAPTSWADILKPEPKYHNKIVMLTDGVDTLAPALLYQHKNVNTEDQAELKDAFNTMRDQAEAVLSYEYVISYVEDKNVERNVYMALGYSGDQSTLNELGGDEWGFVAPKEGTSIWIDCFSIMDFSPNKALALNFLEFINQPKNAAENSVEVGVATTNLEAQKLLPPELRDDESTYPGDDIMASSQLYRILSDDNMSLRGRIVNAVLKQHEAQ